MAAPRIRPRGQSASWASQTARAEVLFDQWATSVGRPVLSQMTESELVKTELYELYVGWLVHTYESQGRTGRLSLGIVKKFFGVVLQLASKRCMVEGWTSPRTVHFFTCLDVRNRTECAAWAAGIKRQIDRDLFDLNVKDGSIMDFSADPIYLHDIEHMCQYWAQFSNQICVQKILTSKATWLISGRAAEC